MTVLRPCLIVLAVLFGLGGRAGAQSGAQDGPQVGAQGGAGFTPAQREEIIGIVRDALKRDPSILRDAVAGLQADDEHRTERATTDAITRLGPALVDPADAIEGNAHGDVTLVEFYDTRCPYCRRMLPEMAQLMHDDPGLRLVMKDLPILGPASLLESRALLAAQRQDGYFRLRDALMASPAPATPDSLRDTAARLGLDAERLVHDMDDPAIKTRLAANIALARELGIQGTPAMVVGHHYIAGAADLDDMRQAIALARREK